MFIVYTDKPTEFECKIELTGASIKEAQARLIVTTSDKKMLFEGSVTNDGTTVVSIPKVKGILDENDVGNMELEIIVDDTYFQPWTGTYNVMTSKKAWVSEVVEQKVDKKPAMKVNVKPQNIDYDRKINRIVENLSKRKITSRNILHSKNKKTVYSLMESAFNKKVENLNTNVILPDIVHKLNEDR
jgi:hypothetical protein